MKVGDFVDVHFEQGCVIGRLLSDDGDTVTVSFDNGILEGIPKGLCTLWVAIERRGLPQ